MKKRLVISAVNIVDGGPLTILAAFLQAMQNTALENWNFIALAHTDVKLNFGRVKRVNFEGPKKSWLLRLYYEYVVFKRISRRLRPEIWLSLHDLTPNVSAPRRFVYCHNPAPFYRPSLRDIWLDHKFFIFNRLYKLFYKINIDKNEAIIVQQHWIKEEFSKITCSPIYVSHPDYLFSKQSPRFSGSNDKLTFVYPAFPRVFKNHAVICEALSRFDANTLAKIRVVFTLDGSENRYAAWLYKCYRHIEALEFRGRLSYQETQSLYQNADCVIFPSKLETWGLPLTEAKHFKKTILASDLPYARETLGSYLNVKYIMPDNINQWCEAMQSLVFKNFQEKINQSAHEVTEPDSLGAVALLTHIVHPKPMSVGLSNNDY